MNPEFYSILSKWTIILIPVLCCLFGARGILHYFQLESYQFPGYFRTLARNKNHAWLPGIVITVVSLALIYLADVLCQSGHSFGRIARMIISLGIASYMFFPLVGNKNHTCKTGIMIVFGGSVLLFLVDLFTQNSIVGAVFGSVLSLVLAAFCGMLVARIFTEKKAKKPFVYTGRVKRLYVVFFLVMLAISGLLAYLTGIPVFCAIWCLALPFVVAFAGLLAWPIEKLISECYFRDARRKLLSSKDLIRIGITGSYGKTSVKHVLGTILSEKYTTLITPASFNTPMGVSRAIRERLTPSYQVFVGEMGARHVGDIKEMCRLVKPTIGIITSVGPQHLETFKSIERVAKTKYELIQALPEDGLCYFYNDGSYCLNMYENTAKPKSLCGTDETTSDVWYSDVSVSPAGSTFTLHIKEKGSIECQTKLLGEHNIHNIVLAAAVASDLGLSLRQIARGVEKLQPVKNRLELMSNPGGFTIINDAFNSNPVGAKAALDVLKQFPARRIIITPGMVELGENEAEYNREFGKQIASAADIAIIVGKNRVTPILEGLKEAGFDQNHMHRVDSLDDSTNLLHTLVKPEDTVLYENDLPDHYQEA